MIAHNQMRAPRADDYKRVIGIINRLSPGPTKHRHQRRAFSALNKMRARKAQQ